MATHNKALLLGILNVTPDSFSDGGFFLEKERAVHRGLELLQEGADILDIGGESTRPGATSISAHEELHRVIPVIQELRTKTNAPISIDTSKAVVAQAAIDVGATIINDVSALGDPKMGKTAAATGATLILMHRQGTAATMQKNPTYPNNDVVTAVMTFLSKARQQALDDGVKKESIILDPGIGFGKTVEHNFALLRAIPQLLQLGSPLLIGHSRKSFLTRIFHADRDEEAAKPGGARQANILMQGCMSTYCPSQNVSLTQHPSVFPDSAVDQYEISGLSQIVSNPEPLSPENRLIPSVAITSLARYHGAMFFRVHDPRSHREALRTIERLYCSYTRH